MHSSGRSTCGRSEFWRIQLPRNDFAILLGSAASYLEQRVARLGRSQTPIGGMHNRKNQNLSQVKTIRCGQSFQNSSFLRGPGGPGCRGPSRKASDFWRIQLPEVPCGMRPPAGKNLRLRDTDETTGRLRSSNLHTKRTWIAPTRLLSCTRIAAGRCFAADPEGLGYETHVARPSFSQPAPDPWHWAGGGLFGSAASWGSSRQVAKAYERRQFYRRLLNAGAS